MAGSGGAAWVSDAADALPDAVAAAGGGVEVAVFDPSAVEREQAANVATSRRGTTRRTQDSLESREDPEPSSVRRVFDRVNDAELRATVDNLAWLARAVAHALTGHA